MTLAYWCVMIAAFLPYLLIAITKVANGYSPKSNREPRVWATELKGWGRRGYHAHLNTFEAFPIFAAAVIIAHLVGNAAQATIDGLAIAFIVARVLYAVLYVADVSLLRTLVWTASICCVLGLFVVSA